MFIKLCMQVEITYMYGSTKTKAQGENKGHVTSAFMWYFFKRKNTIKT